jgi:recombination DNA repair RAD52 pathway protein
MKESTTIQQQLTAPFTMIGVDKKEYPSHKWKPQVCNNIQAICVPYIDARQVSERLNNVLGIDGWSNTLIETTGKGMICELTAIIEGKEVTKSNIGVESDYAKEKGQASDALKRAAVNFGIGAYLYNIEPLTLKTVSVKGKNYPATDKGEALITGDALTSYINMLNPLRAKLIEIYRSLTKEDQKSIEPEFIKIWETLTK